MKKWVKKPLLPSRGFVDSWTVPEIDSAPNEADSTPNTEANAILVSGEAFPSDSTRWTVRKLKFETSARCSWDQAFSSRNFFNN